MNAEDSEKPWEQCPYCKEIFGQVYDKRVRLSSIVESKCARCWAVREILSRVTDTANPGTELVGSIWHDNTLEIGVIAPEDSFETAKGYKIYIVAGNVTESQPLPALNAESRQIPKSTPSRTLR